MGYLMTKSASLTSFSNKLHFIVKISEHCLPPVFFLLLETEILSAMMNSRIFPSSESSENKTIAAQ